MKDLADLFIYVVIMGIIIVASAWFCLEGI
jgi:hypothetical protein